MDDSFEAFVSSIEMMNEKKEEITTESITKKIDSVLLSILSTKFTNQRKLRLVPVQSRINFACPYCLDSKTDPDAKRGNLYIANLFYVCYNCGKKRGFKSFLEDFRMDDEFTYSELEFIKKMSLEGSTNSFSSKRVSEVYNQIVTLQQYGIDRSVVMKLYGFQEIQDVKFVYNYLKERNQLHIDLRTFAYDRDKDALVVFNTSGDYTQVFSFQRRFFKPFKGIRFLTEKYSEICLKMGVEISDENLRNRLDKISYFYNIFKVRFSDDMFIFEGAMDANHIPNSIATWSASNKILLPSGYYLFDNTTIDKAGKDASIELLEQNHQVFLWGKYLEDYPEFRLCKDLDDIRKKKYVKAQDLLKYFSNHPLDAIYL